MLKFFLTICMGATVFLWGSSQGWSVENMDDRFIDPDIASSKDIFIDVKDVSLINFLKIISKQSGLSFIADQDVADKKITLYLNKIPLNQALQIVSDANGLTYEKQDDSDVFLVKAKSKAASLTITKVYPLKYATVSSSKLYSTLSSGGGASKGGLEDAIKNVLSSDGKIIEDTRTNSLIISDVPAQFEAIEGTIAKLDVPIPQILIEVEMLDVSKSVADQLGIKYGATPITFTGGKLASNFPFGKGHASVNSSTTSSSSGSSSPGWDASGMTMELNFLTTNTDARTLARPRILTLNNETAQIQISTEQAISAQSVSSSTTQGASTNSVTVERSTTGVILKVTPQANLMTREITMAVSPKVIDVILSQVQPTGTGVTAAVYDPVTRGSDSMLKLKDGQSMVIGGLMTNQNNNTITKLPFLGDLPVIGAAFRSKNSTKSERELIIFLTPHIIDDLDQSALKENNTSVVQTALDIQNATDHAQEISNSLNNFDMK